MTFEEVGIVRLFVLIKADNSKAKFFSMLLFIVIKILSNVSQQSLRLSLMERVISQGVGGSKETSKVVVRNIRDGLL